MKIQAKPSIINHIPVIHGGRNSIKNSEQNIVDFSSNITPLGFSRYVRRALKKNLDHIQHYPDYYSTELISSLTKFTGIPKSNLLIGNGAIEIIYNFCFAFLSKKTKVLIISIAPLPTNRFDFGMPVKIPNKHNRQ